MAIGDIVWFRRSRRRGSGTASALVGLAAGAAAIALLQPRAGPRRRGRAVQKTIHAGKALEDFGGKAARDLRNRSRGLLASARSRLYAGDAPPEVLCERVRSRLGRLTSHPGAIEVSAHEGVVELHGPILEAEADQVLDGVRGVRGVRGVTDRLERHGDPGGVPGLQGGERRPRPVADVLQQHWAPGKRLLAMIFGIGTALGALRSRGLASLTLGAAGALLGVRAATNLPLKRLLGLGARRRAVDLRKTIHIEAPRAEVFAYFRTFENFPRFMTHVREVRRAGEGRWHWVVEGPAGAAVEWDAEISAFAPDEIIEWKTLPGAVVESSGIARFEDDRSGTRLDIRLSYNPPAGAIGHALATMLGADPKQRMDDDLLRLKSLLERGKAEGVTRDELRPERGS
jgi:uncharacterized membrane protein